jgi:hypothetical protein
MFFEIFANRISSSLPRQPVGPLPEEMRRAFESPAGIFAAFG